VRCNGLEVFLAWLSGTSRRDLCLCFWSVFIPVSYPAITRFRRDLRPAGLARIRISVGTLIFAHPEVNGETIELRWARIASRSPCGNLPELPGTVAAVSPRKTRRRMTARNPDEDAAVPLGPERVEPWPDGDWTVRDVPGSASVKAYRCPGCDQEILPGTPHLVAWPTLIPGIAERRHWHRACWERRLHRRPGPRIRR
jgi:hypothetical protein